MQADRSQRLAQVARERHEQTLLRAGRSLGFTPSPNCVTRANSSGTTAAQQARPVHPRIVVPVRSLFDTASNWLIST